MKSTTQVRKNGATKPALPQIKLPAKNRSEPPTPAPEPPQYTLALISFSNGKEFREGEIAIPLDKMDALIKKSPHPIIEGEKCVDFKGVLEEGLEAMAETPRAWELESAINQNNALIQIFLERIENNGGSDTSFQPFTNNGGKLVCGLQELVWTTQKRLGKALAKQ